MKEIKITSRNYKKKIYLDSKIFFFIFSLLLTSHVETILQSKTKEVRKSPLTYSKYL